VPEVVVPASLECALAGTGEQRQCLGELDITADGPGLLGSRQEPVNSLPQRLDGLDDSHLDPGAVAPGRVKSSCA
jgi:hypothetical protein